jgi:hypothetical protein
MKSRLIATAVMLAVIAQAPAFAAPRVNQAGTELTTPTKQLHAKVNCNSASSCNVLISKCTERDGNWNPQGYNKQGQPVKGNCTGL